MGSMSFELTRNIDRSSYGRSSMETAIRLLEGSATKPALYPPQTSFKEPFTPFKGPPMYGSSHIVPMITSALSLPYISPKPLQTSLITYNPLQKDPPTYRNSHLSVYLYPYLHLCLYLFLYSISPFKGALHPQEIPSECISLSLRLDDLETQLRGAREQVKAAAAGLAHTLTVCTYAYTYIYIERGIYAYIQIYVYIYTCVCTYICIRICICIYIYA